MAVFEIDKVEVKRAQALFCSGRMSSRTPTKFRHWLGLYARYLSFNQIADIVGLSRTAVHARYNDHFRLVFPHVSSGRARLKAILAKRFAPGPLRFQPSPARLVALVARNKGLSVKPVAIREGASRSSLLIEGKLCRVHCRVGASVANQAYPAGRYSSFWLSPGAHPEVEFFVLVQKVARKTHIFIIPHSVLGQVSRGRRAFSIYVPAVHARSKKGQRMVRFDALKYRGAWNLLRRVR